ncbi:hypothetical protein ILYODFUR_016661 [Ilyodon furcidens]|uniref:Uncharacterized protein n=1 Tax=Ilyodon furcidens TaxID=33524 RepID=A0ABV0TN89_9TELE
MPNCFLNGIQTCKIQINDTNCGAEVQHAGSFSARNESSGPLSHSCELLHTVSIFNIISTLRKQLTLSSINDSSSRGCLH